MSDINFISMNEREVVIHREGYKYRKYPLSEITKSSFDRLNNWLDSNELQNPLVNLSKHGFYIEIYL
jgi:hypothetical protein